MALKHFMPCPPSETENSSCHPVTRKQIEFLSMINNIEGATNNNQVEFDWKKDSGQYYSFANSCFLISLHKIIFIQLSSTHTSALTLHTQIMCLLPSETYWMYTLPLYTRGQQVNVASVHFFKSLDDGLNRVIG